MNKFVDNILFPFIISFTVCLILSSGLIYFIEGAYVKDLQKQAVKHNHAKYESDNGSPKFTWIVDSE